MERAPMMLLREWTPLLESRARQTALLDCWATWASRLCFALRWPSRRPASIVGGPASRSLTIALETSTWSPLWTRTRWCVRSLVSCDACPGVGPFDGATQSSAWGVVYRMVPHQ